MNHFILTGSSRGIGLALAEELLADPANRLLGISRSNSIDHPNYRHLHLDLSAAGQAAKVAFPVIGEEDRVFLVNNAAALGPISHFRKINPEILEGLYRLNLTAPIELAARFMQAYRGRGAQRVIVNISTGAAKRAYPSWANYCTTKAGLDMWSMTLAEEEATYPPAERFEVYAIAPGVVDTAMQEQIRSTDPSDFADRDKFTGLHENGELYDASAVARILAKQMKDTSRISEVVSRIQL